MMIMTITNTFSNTRQSSLKSSQAGVVLVIGLVMLSVLTMIALAAAKSVTFQEKMAFNTQERNKALQAAESASRYAWSILGTANYKESDFIT
ncbi:MAG: PilX N-terminal domain-containing pilus assembly protein, partial [Methylococcales bacterium]